MFWVTFQIFLWSSCFLFRFRFLRRIAKLSSNCLLSCLGMSDLDFWGGLPSSVPTIFLPVRWCHFSLYFTATSLLLYLPSYIKYYCQVSPNVLSKHHQFVWGSYTCFCWFWTELSWSCTWAGEQQSPGNEFVAKCFQCTVWVPLSVWGSLSCGSLSRVPWCTCQVPQPAWGVSSLSAIRCLPMYCQSTVNLPGGVTPAFCWFWTELSWSCTWAGEQQSPGNEFVAECFQCTVWVPLSVWGSLFVVHCQVSLVVLSSTLLWSHFSHCFQVSPGVCFLSSSWGVTFVCQPASSSSWLPSHFNFHLRLYKCWGLISRVPTGLRWEVRATTIQQTQIILDLLIWNLYSSILEVCTKIIINKTRKHN